MVCTQCVMCEGMCNMRACVCVCSCSYADAGLRYRARASKQPGCGSVAQSGRTSLCLKSRIPAISHVLSYWHCFILTCSFRLIFSQWYFRSALVFFQMGEIVTSEFSLPNGCFFSHYPMIDIKIIRMCCQNKFSVDVLLLFVRSEPR